MIWHESVRPSPKFIAATRGSHDQPTTSLSCATAYQRQAALAPEHNPVGQSASLMQSTA